MCSSRFDLVSYQGYVTQNTTNFCQNWKNTCNHILEHIQCPDYKKEVNGCEDDENPYVSWPVSGASCKCGSWEQGRLVYNPMFAHFAIVYIIYGA